MKDLLLLYLVTINAAGFVLMLADKHKAKKKLWRIPEATLMTVAALGGSVGSLLGMYTVRHKTKRPKFTVGIPLLLALQIIAAVVVMAKFPGIFAQNDSAVRIMRTALLPCLLPTEPSGQSRLRSKRSISGTGGRSTRFGCTPGHGRGWRSGLPLPPQKIRRKP